MKEQALVSSSPQAFASHSVVPNGSGRPGGEDFRQKVLT